MRSANAFKLTAADLVQGEATLPSITEESKNLHVLNVTFKAPTEPGATHTIVELKTDIPGEPPLRLTAFVNVAP
jgi:hypothetical protein